MAAINKKLQQLLDETKMTVSDLARAIDIAQPVLYRLAKGITDNPKVDTIRPIAKFYAITIGQLLGDEHLPPIAERKKYPLESFVELPFLRLNQVPDWLKDKSSVTWQETLKVWGNPGEFAFCYRVDDATMRERFPEGALIVVDPDHPFKDHDYVIAQTPNQQAPVFRQILLDGNNRYLKPINADFPIVKMMPENKILGAMIELKMGYKDLRN